MQMAVGISVHRSNCRISDIDTTKRIGPDMRVNGDTIRSHISTACSSEITVWKSLSSVMAVCVLEDCTTRCCLEGQWCSALLQKKPNSLVYRALHSRNRTGSCRHGTNFCLELRKTYLNRVSVPDVTFKDQGLVVGSPRVSRPSEDLHEELVICLESGCQCALRGHLHVHLPAMGHDPAGHVLVISRNEWVPAQWCHAR